MKSPQKIFEEYLIQNDSRFTLQKRLITGEIFKTRSHFEIEDFIAKQRSKKNRFARATVYRTIRQLFEAGLLQKIDGQDRKVFYERSHPKKQHDHLICTNCERVIEFCDPRIQGIKNLIEENMNFKINRHALNFYGECADKETCQENK